MKLSKLIERLQADLAEFGDVDCYTNGEHGIGEVEELTDSCVGTASACINFDANHLMKDDSDIVCHIGGY